jgi:flagellar hook-length control protein FliK
MKTTAFDKRSSLNPKGGLALLVKALAKFSIHPVHSGKKSLFANTLGQKISQAADMSSPSESAVLLPDGENFLPAGMKRVSLNGNGEPVSKGEKIMMADNHFLLLNCDNEPSEMITGETESELALFQISSQREDAGIPIAGSAGKKPQTLLENSELTGEQKTAIHLSTDRMGQFTTASIAREASPQADKPRPENAASPIVHLHEPGTAFFLQALKPQGATYLENKPNDSLMGEPLFIRSADETSKLNMDRLAADIPLSTDPRAGKVVELSTQNSGEEHSRKGQPRFDCYDDHQTPLAEAEHRNESMLTQTADETHKLNITKTASDTSLSSNTITAIPEESAATPASREVHPLSDRYVYHRSQLKEAERRTEPLLGRAADETQKLQQDELETDATLSDISQSIPSHSVQLDQTGKSQKKRWMSGIPQESIPVAKDGKAAIGQASSEFLAPRQSQEKTLRIKNIAIESPGTVGDRQKSRNAASDHRSGISGSDIFPFRIEMPNIVSAQEITASSSVGAKGIEMQTVINQILEARQNASNDLGRVRIQLDPPNLGTVDLDIVVRGERVAVLMTAENATVQQALQSRADDIRIAIQRQDLKIEGFQVVLQDDGTSQQQTNSGTMYRQTREQRERFTVNEDIPSVLPIFSYWAGEESAAGFVSIFV